MDDPTKQLVRDALASALADYLSARTDFDKDFIAAIESRVEAKLVQVVDNALMIHTSRMQQLVHEEIRRGIRELGKTMSGHY